MSISTLGPGITSTNTLQNTSIDNTTIGATTPSTASFTTVSAQSENLSGDLLVATGRATVSAQTITGKLTGNTAAFSGVVSADSGLRTTIVSADSINVTGDVSAAGGSVYTSALRTTAFLGNVVIVSALGTTQAAGAPLTAVINRGQGVTDGQTTGFVLQANKTGLVQYLINETAVSGNLWPPIGGKINNGAANGVFVLAANTSYTIFHYAASAYGVK